MIRRPALARDTRGATIIEFAIVAPVMILLIMGLSDMCYRLYLQAVLTGAVQKAGRDSSIQGAGDKIAAIDAKVMAAVNQIAPQASGVPSRINYDNFRAVGPEPFTDRNNDGIRQGGECYSDINGNSRWDTDPGSSGQGGASDITIYSMRVTYPRLFPMYALIGLPANQIISARTVFKNQPYATQTVATVKSICA